jgi:ubiquinone/menaquinone biosynthesis C-methylase UbiE
MASDQSLTNPIHEYYNQGREQNRLLSAGGKLEFTRTQEIILRYLQTPPAVILDIGGGAGIHALPLANLGYEVHLRDIIPLHIEQALSASQDQQNHPLASVRIGDARQLEFADNIADAVLLLGPLYHLTERSERVQALKEAYRVLRPSGVLVAAIISRYASLFDGVARGFLADPYFAEIVERDLDEGQHRNPKNEPGYFSTAYFHHPDEVRDEVIEAGFQLEAILPVEGPGWLMPDFDTFWENEANRERLLHIIRKVESDPAILSVSAHIVAVSRKP